MAIVALSAVGPGGTRKGSSPLAGHVERGIDRCVGLGRKGVVTGTFTKTRTFMSDRRRAAALLAEARRLKPARGLKEI